MHQLLSIKLYSVLPSTLGYLQHNSLNRCTFAFTVKNTPDYTICTFEKILYNHVPLFQLLNRLYSHFNAHFEHIMLEHKTCIDIGMVSFFLKNISDFDEKFVYFTRLSLVSLTMKRLFKPLSNDYYFFFL